MPEFVDKKFLLAASLLAIVGCSSDSFDDAVRNDLKEKFSSMDAVQVNGVVEDVRLIPAAHLRWPSGSVTRKAEDLFARIELSDNQCYLVGPRLSSWADVGDRLKGEVLSRLVDDWPLEVFASNSLCAPLGDMELQSPVR